MELRISDVLKEAASFKCFDCENLPNCNSQRRRMLKQVLHRLGELAAHKQPDKSELQQLMQDLMNHRTCTATLGSSA